MNLMPTVEGKEVEGISTNYGYKSPWSYSEDLRDLIGPVKLESESFMEHKVIGKVFMYSI